jgi:membrane protease YdiL (CAAX protease family)
MGATMTSAQPVSVPPVSSARTGSLLRALALGALFAATVVALALPIGFGYIAYQRWIAGHSLQEATLHLEDALLLLQAIASLLALGAALAWIAFFQRRIDRQGDLRAIGFGRVAGGGLMLGAGALAGLLLAAIPIGLGLAAGQLTIGASHAAAEGIGDVFLDAFGAAVIAVGLIIAEELVFRGYVPWTLDRGGWPAAASILVPAFFFALYRLILAPASWAVFLNALAASIVLGLLTRRVRSLNVAIAARLAWALVIGVVFSLPMGGSPVEGIVHTIPSPGLVLDGLAGPEGSWLLLPVFLLAIGLAWFLQRQARPG